ncbi:laccase-15-like protein [Carex littledalei]|uniref:Laccase-15-like protein n=1 Tax=Carex littledalei TaxID=544730 RepID=A0A833RDC7_9POAL|nr:laccase-15-like protein [Carex littledalei]
MREGEEPEPIGADRSRECGIQEATYTRLCNNTKNILTVNGLYPGPTISARKGDIVYVKVINRGNKNISIHCRGTRGQMDQNTLLSALSSQEPTTHNDYNLRKNHGAIIIYPKLGTTFPFSKPDKEFTLILGEWWKKNITDVYQTAVENGGQFDTSDANTINGQPGDFMPCSKNGNLLFSVYFVIKSTKVKVLEYNTTVEIVFQQNNILSGAANQPLHLHGHSFYVIGRGFGNFENTTDPLSYNLVDPPFVNTVGVPQNGWATIRFRATNPGVWYMHCHFEPHSIWGMDVVFITKNGNSTEAKILPPPADKPPC